MSFVDDMFGGSGLDGSREQSIHERKHAALGQCPAARVCATKEDLAGWFKSVGIAAGVIAKSAK
jgi:hypothetical protein